VQRSVVEVPKCSNARGQPSLFGVLRSSPKTPGIHIIGGSVVSYWCTQYRKMSSIRRACTVSRDGPGWFTPILHVPKGTPSSSPTQSPPVQLPPLSDASKSLLVNNELAARSKPRVLPTEYTKVNAAELRKNVRFSRCWLTM